MFPKSDGDAGLQAYIASMEPWQAAIAKRVDALVVKHVPGVRKAVRWHCPFYGVEGQGWFLLSTQAIVVLAESGWSALIIASQPLDVAHRRLTEEPLVLPAELRGIVVADPVASGRSVELAGDE